MFDTRGFKYEIEEKTKHEFLHITVSGIPILFGLYIISVIECKVLIYIQHILEGKIIKRNVSKDKLHVILRKVSDFYFSLIYYTCKIFHQNTIIISSLYISLYKLLFQQFAI